MRRADRLFEIVQHLRGGRLLTAQMLAERLEVSKRTIYRDLVDLQASGVPIEGEAGVGYLLASDYHLPPLSFNQDELAALVLGARMTKAWAGQELAQAAEEALVKIDAVLPEEMRARVHENAIFAPSFNIPDDYKSRLDELRRATDRRSYVELDYESLKGVSSRRRVRPLGLFFWGKVWTLVGWCELRQDFRSFRVDLIRAVLVFDQAFLREDGRELRDFLIRMKAEEADCPQSSL